MAQVYGLCGGTIPVGTRVRTWIMIGEGLGNNLGPASDRSGYIIAPTHYLGEGAVTQELSTDGRKRYKVQLDNGSKLDFAKNESYMLSKID